jgi:hypothetical protein
MKCDSEVKFGVGGIFLPIKCLFVISKIGCLISKIWSGVAFYVPEKQRIRRIFSKKNYYELASNTIGTIFQQLKYKHLKTKFLINVLSTAMLIV